MNRLMKAEWYRVRHSTGFMKWLFVICVICVALPFLTDYEAYQKNLAENLITAQTAMIVFIPCILSLYAAVIVGIAYKNKTAYYEVMAGNKIFDIVFSKVFVDGALITVSVSVCFWIYWLIIGICNGMGEIRQLPLRIFLLFVVFFHICISGILIVTSVKQIVGVVLVYLRFVVVESVIMVLFQLFESSFSDGMTGKIEGWFTVLKMTTILSPECRITGHFIFAVLAGLLLESAFWYLISDIGMRKRNYK